MLGMKKGLGRESIAPEDGRGSACADHIVFIIRHSGWRVCDGAHRKNVMKTSVVDKRSGAMQPAARNREGMQRQKACPSGESGGRMTGGVYY